MKKTSPSKEVASVLDDREFRWRLYEDNREYARFHESQRSTATNLIVAVSAGLLGLMTYDNKFDVTDIPSSVFLICLGIFGAVFSAKHYERARLHLNRARRFLQSLDESIPGVDAQEIKRLGDLDNQKRFPVLTKFKLNFFWLVLHLMISLLGIALLTVILLGGK